MPVIGFLGSRHRPTRSPVSVRGISPGPERSRLRRGPATSRSNIAGRKADYDRLPALAAELVRRQVAVIVARRHRCRHLRRRRRPRQFRSSSTSAATRSGSDLSPASTGRAATSPACNYLAVELGAKRLELAARAGADRHAIAVLVNPTNPRAEPRLKTWRRPRGARAASRMSLSAAPRARFEAAFATLARDSGPTRSCRAPTRCSSAGADSCDAGGPPCDSRDLSVRATSPKPAV